LHKDTHRLFNSLILKHFLTMNPFWINDMDMGCGQQRLLNRHVCLWPKIYLITCGSCLSAVFVLWSPKRALIAFLMSLNDGIANQIIF